MDGRQEEPVECEHRGDRDADPETRPPEDGDRKHGEDVEHAQAEHGDGQLQELDRARHRGDRDDAGDDADPAMAPGGLVEHGGEAFHELHGRRRDVRTLLPGQRICNAYAVVFCAHGEGHANR